MELWLEQSMFSFTKWNIIRLLGHFKARQRLRQNNFIVESAVKKKTLMRLMRN